MYFVLNFEILKRLIEPANLITLSGLFVMLAAFYLKMLGVDLPLLLYILMFLYGYQIADHIDGYVARATGKESIFGEFLDLYVDRVADLLLCILVLANRPEYYPAIFVFFLFKFGSEHVLGRMIGKVDHKDSDHTKFSGIYTLFHNKWVLELYLLVKTLFFIPIVVGYPIPYMEYIFSAVVAFRGLYIIELFSSLAASKKQL